MDNLQVSKGVLTAVKLRLPVAEYYDLFGFSHLEQCNQTKAKWTLMSFAGLWGCLVFVWFGIFTTVASMSARYLGGVVVYFLNRKSIELVKKLKT